MVVWSLMPAAWLSGLNGIVVQSVPLVLGAVGFGAVMVARGRASWRMMGWGGGRPHGVAFLGGLGVGAATALGALLVAVVAGGARIVLTGEPLGSYLPAAGWVGVGLGLAALAEELVFRGYPLARLAEVTGKARASVLLAVPFALVHLGNPEVSALGIANVGLASLVMSAAFFTLGGLPAAWGVHLGWNGALAIGADAPVSGITPGLPMLEFDAGAPIWITGGTFGPEGGLAATVAMGGTLIWLSRRAVRAEEGGVT
jgi:membrane protease YdiL (CAAX protease family)